MTLPVYCPVAPELAKKLREGGLTSTGRVRLTMGDDNVITVTELPPGLEEWLAGGTVSALPEPPAPPEDCCCNAEWRGRLCAYHQGFEDGWEALREALEK